MRHERLGVTVAERKPETGSAVYARRNDAAPHPLSESNQWFAAAARPGTGTGLHGLGPTRRSGRLGQTQLTARCRYPAARTGIAQGHRRMKRSRATHMRTRAGAHGQQVAQR